METNHLSKRIHPLMATAAVSVTLASLLGVAAITGLLPNSNSTTTPVILSTPAPTSASTAFDTSRIESSNTKALPQPSAPKIQSEHASSLNRVTQATNSQHRTVHQTVPTTTVASTTRVCESCGKIEAVHTIQQPAKSSGLGVAAGAVLGGVLGNQVGNGNGRTLATIAGAVGGGYAGNEVEKRTRLATSYQVRVRMEDGRIRTFPYSEQPNWNIGDRVKVIDGVLTSRG